MTSTPRALIAATACALALTACAGDEEPETDPTGDVDTAEEDAADDDAADEAEQDAADDDAADDDGAADEDMADDDAADDGEGSDEAATEDGTSVAVDTAELGDVLVDGDGMTLYLFEPDEQGPSQCYDDCAGNWPPLITDGDPVADAGADPELLGTVERDDGSLQVTYDDWPLYHFAGDQAAGDVAGQGVNEVWWVLAPDGTPIRGDAEEADASDGAGY